MTYEDFAHWMWYNNNSKPLKFNHMNKINDIVDNYNMGLITEHEALNQIFNYLKEIGV